MEGGRNAFKGYVTRDRKEKTYLSPRSAECRPKRRARELDFDPLRDTGVSTTVAAHRKGSPTRDGEKEKVKRTKTAG